jgi:hypothetical protein
MKALMQLRQGLHPCYNINMIKVNVFYFSGGKHTYEFVTKIGALTFASEQRSLANVAEVRIS